LPPDLDLSGAERLLRKYAAMELKKRERAAHDDRGRN
jgi:hypothetical protein